MLKGVNQTSWIEFNHVYGRLVYFKFESSSKKFKSNRILMSKMVVGGGGAKHAKCRWKEWGRREYFNYSFKNIYH